MWQLMIYHPVSSNVRVYFLNSFSEGISFISLGIECQAFAPLINTLFSTVVLSVKGTLKAIDWC